MAPCGTATRPTCRPVRRGSSPALPSRSRRAANVPVAASSGGSADRSGSRWPPPFRAGAGPAAVGVGRATVGVRAGGGGLGGARRASSTSASTAAMSKSTASSAAGRGVARREVGGDALGDPAVAAAPAAQRRLGHGSGVRLGRADAAPAGPRPADPVGVGRPVDLARRGEPGRCRPAAARTC